MLILYNDYDWELVRTIQFNEQQPLITQFILPCYDESAPRGKCYRKNPTFTLFAELSELYLHNNNKNHKYRIIYIA